MADDEKREGADDLKVNDRRRFTTEGETKKSEGADASASGTDAPNVDAAADKKSHATAVPHHEIDFATFILSLATSAQVHLGNVANPATGKQEKDISLARQTIDIIAMLEEKTKRNLSAEEERLLEHVLFDLRMQYVEQNKNTKG